jgi:hypothetical protein
VAYLFLAFYGWALWADAPHAGRLVCSQADDRCEIDHGWLLVDREPFPSADLLGAKVVRQADPFSFGGDSWTVRRLWFIRRRSKRPLTEGGR